MSFGKRQQPGSTTAGARRTYDEEAKAPRLTSTTKAAVFGALTGIVGVLATIALIIGGTLFKDRTHALELAERFAYQPADGPGYVNRKHNAQSRVDNECLGLWDNTLSGVRNAMLCYSTRSPERLCESLEKELFVALIDEYLHFERQMAANIAATPAPILNFIESNLAAFPKAIPRDKITESWRNLSRIGVMDKGDFGWFPDDSIATAFADVDVKRDVCSDS